MLSQVPLRSGAAPMMGALNMNGFTIANLGESSDPAGAVTNAQLSAALAAITTATQEASPPGAVKGFRRKTPPRGWIVENGGTIGNASSGGSTRADADTQDLFAVMWGQFNDSEAPIFTSTGAASTRGASAIADFNANKRIRLFDSRTRFLRGSDSGAGFDGTLVPGLTQADAFKTHVHSGTTNSGGGQPRTFETSDGAGNNPDEPLRGNGLGGTLLGTTNSATPHAHSFTTNATGIALETRPRSSVVLYCIKL